jgi:hypothetical protein
VLSIWVFWIILLSGVIAAVALRKRMPLKAHTIANITLSAIVVLVSILFNQESRYREANDALYAARQSQLQQQRADANRRQVWEAHKRRLAWNLAHPREIAAAKARLRAQLEAAAEAPRRAKLQAKLAAERREQAQLTAARVRQEATGSRWVASGCDDPSVPCLPNSAFTREASTDYVFPSSSAFCRWFAFSVASINAHTSDNSDAADDFVKSIGGHITDAGEEFEVLGHVRPECSDNPEAHHIDMYYVRSSDGSEGYIGSASLEQ